MENVKDPGDRTVIILVGQREIARGEFQRLDVDTAPCIFCQGDSNCCFEFRGSHPGKIFTCDICKVAMLAKDIKLHMPWRPVISSVKVTLEGEDVGVVGMDKVSY